MKLEQFQVNNKFLNSLPPEWSKFVTGVNLVKDLHTTNYDQLHAYLEQHKLHANEVLNQQTHLAELPHIDSSLAVPVFKQGDDPIDSINKMMSFLSTVVTSHFPSTQILAKKLIRSPRTYKELFMMARVMLPTTDKVLLVEAQGNGKVLNEEELEFLADPGIVERFQLHSRSLPHNAYYQPMIWKAYASNSDEISTAKAVLMANLSSYSSNVLSEVPHSDNTHNDMLNQSVLKIPYSKQTHLVNYPENEITSDSFIHS
ncbi:hypothetical protein Tco_0117418 [Tanacetum coccineum]